MLVGDGGQLVDDALQRRQHHFLARVAQHQRVAQVVDVFRGAGEVDELQRLGGLRVGGEFLAQPVFDGFHVVVGAALDGLDLLGIVFGELRGDLVELRDGGGGEGRQFLDAGFIAQRLEPFDLDQHAIADQAEFAEMAAQGVHFAVVAAIKGTQGGEGGKRHGSVLSGNCKRVFYPLACRARAIG